MGDVGLSANLKENLSYGRLLRLALPVIGMQFILQIMSFIEFIFAGRSELVVLNAVNVGSIFYSILTMICYAFGIGFQIQLSKYLARNQVSWFSSFLTHYFGLYIMVVVLLLGAGFGFGIWFQKQETSYQQALGTYIFWRTLGLVPIAIVYSGRSYFVSIGKTSVLFLNGIYMALFSILGNFIGYWKGMLSLKMIISASLLGEWAGAIHIGYRYWKESSHVSLRIPDSVQFKRLYIERLLLYVMPLVIQYTIGLTSWFLFFQWIARYGTEALGASSVFKNLYLLCLLPGFGMNVILNSLGAYVLGQRRADWLLLLYRRAIVLNGVFVFSLVCVIYLFPDLIIGFFTKERTIKELVQTFYWWLIPILVTFVISTPAFNLLLSTGRTVFSMISELSSVFLYLVVVSLLIWYWQVPFQWVWSAEVVYWLCLWIMSFGFLRWFIRQYGMKKR